MAPGEKPEHAEEVGAMKNRGDNRDRVPASKGKDPGCSPEAFRGDIVGGEFSEQRHGVTCDF